MRVLGVLAAWGVLAVLATLCFAVGGSIGYRRGVQDAVRQLRERRSGNTGCRPVPLSHHRRRPIARLGQRWASSRSRAGARRPAFAAYGLRPRRIAGIRLSPAAIGAAVTVCVLAVPGVAIGATTAEPGERLWSVKRGLEQARLVLATGADSEVEVHVNLAARRLSELSELMGAGNADRQVVTTVIEGLKDHTEAATARLGDVDRADRAALVERLNGYVERQIAVIGLLMDVDCADGTGDQPCVALARADEASEALAQTTGVVVMRDDPPVAIEPAEGPSDVGVSAVATAQSESEPAVAAATTEASAAASETPSATSTATPSPGPSASPSPSATPPATAASTAPAQTATGKPTPGGAAAAAKPATGPNAGDKALDTAATDPTSTVDAVELDSNGRGRDVRP
jgi:Domain of unknown function (DUF5667)